MRYLIGLLIVVLGVSLFLNATGAANSDRIMEIVWPSFIVGIGLISFRSNPRNWFGPVLIMLIGLAFLFSNLDILPGNWGDYFFPGLLVLIGIRVIVGRSNRDNAVAGSETKNAFAAFSGVDKNVSGDFTGTDLSVAFGGMKLDLRNANIQDNATISVFAAFGGIDVFVPKSVNVKTDVLPLFGGASNKTQPDSGATKTLKISGTALFGGVEVKN